MVLLLQRFNKLYSKPENHHHHHHQHCRRRESEALLTSYLQEFVSEVSSCLNLLPSSESLTFPWILQFLQVLPVVHHAFVKFVVNLEYPVRNWEADLADAYLNYSLHLLDRFNSVSFSLSRLSQSRLLLAHAVSLIESSPSSAIKRLSPIVLRGAKDCEEIGEVGEIQKNRRRSGKERAIRQALTVMEEIGYGICEIVISAFQGDSAAVSEARRSASDGDLIVDSLKRLDSIRFKVITEKSVVKEVVEVNDATVELSAALVAGESGGDAAAEMRRRLENLEKMVESLGKEVNGQFSEVMAGRSQLIDIFRQQKN